MVLNSIICLNISQFYTKNNDFNNNEYILKVYANDIEMDTMLIFSSGLITSDLKIDYENKLEVPIAKLTNITFKIYDFNNNVVFDNSVSDTYLTCIIRYYEPISNFNMNYNELNPHYDTNRFLNNFTLGSEIESEDESESEDEIR